MRDRMTARVLLFDPEGRILLVRGRMTDALPPRWFTPGGGMEPGESVLEGALRELREETGIAPHEVGPIVWLRKGSGTLHSGEQVMFREHFVVARTTVTDLDRSGWEAHEIALMDDMRWWSAEELAATEELMAPDDLMILIEDLRRAIYPAEPIVLPDWNTL